MKRMMNLTTWDGDLGRFADHKDLQAFYRQHHLDGVEALWAGEDRNQILRPEDVIGVHLRYFTAWMDLWQGNTSRLLAEYDDMETIEQVYGGRTRQAIVDAYRSEFAYAGQMQCEYMVFHVSECTLEESMRRTYFYSDEEVIDAVIELINKVTDAITGTPWILFENLWHSGLTLRRPDVVYRLLDGIHYPYTGIMLDIGHLLHTNTTLRSMDQAIEFIHSVLDQYPDLSFVRGVHLHQSLSGTVSEDLMAHWRTETGSYQERKNRVLNEIIRIDTHQPFLSPQLPELITRIHPDYLVCELLSHSREEHAAMLDRQVLCLESTCV